MCRSGAMFKDKGPHSAFGNRSVRPTGFKCITKAESGPSTGHDPDKVLSTRRSSLFSHKRGPNRVFKGQGL